MTPSSPTVQCAVCRLLYRAVLTRGPDGAVAQSSDDLNVPRLKLVHTEQRRCSEVGD